jgi:hypothetical protein
MTDPNVITEDYLAAVAANRRKTREQWGDDYGNGKNASFLITVLSAAIGEVADAVIGNASDDTMEDALAAQELMVDVGGICVSLYEWFGREAEAIANECDELA